MATFEELKAKGWPKLNKEEREEYVKFKSQLESGGEVKTEPTEPDLNALTDGTTEPAKLLYSHSEVNTATDASSVPPLEKVSPALIEAIEKKEHVALVSSANVDELLKNLYWALGDGAYRARLNEIKSVVNYSIDELKQALESFKNEIREGEVKALISTTIAQL